MFPLKFYVEPKFKIGQIVAVFSEEEMLQQGVIVSAEVCKNDPMWTYLIEIYIIAENHASGQRKAVNYILCKEDELTLIP